MFHIPEPIDTAPASKALLRKQLRQQRAAVTPAERHAAGQQLARLALRHRLLARNRRIGFYMPSKNEIDVLPLLRTALRMGVACYLPVVPRRALVGARRHKLWFTRLAGKEIALDQAHPAWVNNRYGIPEYLPRAARRVRSRQLDLLFMPMLGFDRRGWRIGMGGGYYDASLAYLGETKTRRAHWRRPRLIGVAFSVQEIARAPNDPWDVPLNGILTERAYLRVPPG
ncbi:MAG: 5-formyltetrahydrofolate cyclo-ligase [Hydrogenophilales bacterium 28-61-23]|nr:MAG: 5-formyltetrahydrofolate cyclo-ligase [Hydrogenophilales bacterium 28-61-23]